MSSLAPIALFAYRRPRHLAAVLDGLERCPEFSASEVHVFSDGPRDDRDAEAVQAVRSMVRTRLRPNMQLHERTRNRGLAASIIAEVDALCRSAGRVIVIEDDLVLHPSALDWFNRGLDAYAHDDQVMQIGGYQYRVPEFADRTSGVFQRFVTSWGWATWERAWRRFDPVADGWAAVVDDPAVRRAFDAGGAYPFSDMLERQMRGRLDSWAIRWNWSVFRAGGLSLMPPRTLVRNIGFDDTATHNSLGPLKAFVSGPPPLAWAEDGPPELPAGVGVDPVEEAAFRRGLRRTNAVRNLEIKRVLARAGLRRFA